MAYLLAGGYALLHRRHVRIDVIYEALSPRMRARLDAFTFVFFVAYMLTLIWYGGVDAWNSFQIGETTSTPWNPVIWPVKAAIPAAGLLLLLQGISNLIRDLGWAPGGRVAMSIEFLSILFVAVFAVTLLTGLPLAFATGAVAVVFAVVLFGMPGLTLIVSRMYTLMGNYVLVSVPLFIFMACILERAGIAEAIFRAVHVWAGRLRGGLAVAVIISCALMAAMVGVIGAEIVTMGVVALPAMLEKNYKKDLALGCICAGGGLATLIPPSVVFIMFGLTAGVSIGQLYMAGVIPGLMLAGHVHRLHHRPLQAAARAGAAGLGRGPGDAAAREARPAQGADPPGPGGLQRARLALHGLGHADRGGRRRRRRRGARRGLEPQAQLGRASAAR